MNDRIRVCFAGVTCAITASVCAQVGPSGVDLHLIRPVLEGDARMIALGDSFSTPTFTIARVFPQAALTWPHAGLTAFSVGMNRLSGFATFDAGTTGIQYVGAGPDNYSILRDSPGLPSFYALPVNDIAEWYFDGSVTYSDGFATLGSLRVNAGTINPILGGPFSQAGDRVRFRPLFWSAPADEPTVDLIRVEGSPGSSGEWNPNAEARPKWYFCEDPGIDPPRTPDALQINAAPFDLDLDPSDPVAVFNGGEQAILGMEQYFHGAGGVFYKADPATGERLPGLYYQFLADNSWSYEGFGSSVPSSNQNDKRYTTEQLAHWLDVTTLDRQQPTYFFYYVAAEGGTLEDLADDMRAMVAQSQAAADDVGLTHVRHCIVVPHLHVVPSLPFAEAVAAVERNRDAAFLVAHERADTAALSIYDATDGVFFNTPSSGAQWLLDNGYNIIDYGTQSVDLINRPGGARLLDTPLLHPLDQPSAALFTTVAGDVLASAPLPATSDSNLCPGDANGDLVVDTADITFVVSNLGADALCGISPPGDADGSLETTTADLTLVVSNLGNSCR